MTKQMRVKPCIEILLNRISQKGKIQEIVENYAVPDDTDDYYTQYNKHKRSS